ncbi:WhiB family transcriptional regulator [Streptomyces sp. NPDC020403]|uniref:WhiB family transcriptional regulator n=1 Tax=unclassified Streptomyces TaxID=2593676 RepID=UPI00340681EB
MTVSLFHQPAPDTVDHGDRWREQALCADPVYDPEAWHPVGTGPGAQQQTVVAKAVCHRCPVMDICLRWALDQREDTGIWGGLDEEERRRIHGRRAPSTVTAKPRPTGLVDALARQSITLPDGHTLWTGSNPVRIKGICYTPGQVAWHAAHGGPPVGRLSTGCDRPGCITVGHLLDDTLRATRHGTPAAYKVHERRGEEPCEECKAARRAHDRARRGPAVCGTRPGYQKHRRQGETPCDPCRQANADADRRLRNTGTTKQLATA